MASKPKWLENSSLYELTNVALEEIASLPLDAKLTKKLATTVKEIKERSQDTDSTGVVGLADQIAQLSADIKAHYTAESILVKEIEKAETIVEESKETKKKKPGRPKKANPLPEDAEKEAVKEESGAEEPKRKKGRPRKVFDSTEMSDKEVKRALKQLGFSKEDISAMSKKEMRSALDAQ